MKFTPTPLKDAYLIDLEPHSDSRGLFARVFCQEIFQKWGLDSRVAQANCSWSKEVGTLRGLHYQLPPAEETKLVRCISGSIYDVILDLRPDSSTFGHSFGATLSAANRSMLYVPRGFAHGFITLEPESEVLYMVSAPYSKELERGIRWDDPYFAIEWPIVPRVISERDRVHPSYQNSNSRFA